MLENVSEHKSGSCSYLRGHMRPGLGSCLSTQLEVKDGAG